MPSVATPRYLQIYSKQGCVSEVISLLISWSSGVGPHSHFKTAVFLSSCLFFLAQIDNLKSCSEILSSRDLTSCGEKTEQPWWLRADQSRGGCFGVQLGILSQSFQCQGWIFIWLWEYGWFQWLPIFIWAWVYGWGVPTIWQVDDQTSERDLVSHSPEQVKGKRIVLHAVVRDVLMWAVSGKKTHF